MHPEQLEVELKMDFIANIDLHKKKQLMHNRLKKTTSGENGCPELQSSHSENCAVIRVKKSAYPVSTELCKSRK